MIIPKKWYSDHFVAESGSIETFVRQHADPPVLEKLDHAGAIRFIDYDWRLNRPGNFPEFN